MHLPERRAKHANLAGLRGMTICQADIVRQIEQVYTFRILQVRYPLSSGG
jgi:hypothetical protein